MFVLSNTLKNVFAKHKNKMAYLQKKFVMLYISLKIFAVGKQDIFGRLSTLFFYSFQTKM